MSQNRLFTVVDVGVKIVTKAFTVLGTVAEIAANRSKQEEENKGEADGSDKTTSPRPIDLFRIIKLNEIPNDDGSDTLKINAMLELQENLTYGVAAILDKLRNLEEKIESIENELSRCHNQLNSIEDTNSRILNRID